MSRKFSFSGQHQHLPDIVAHHTDVVASMRRYFNPQNAITNQRFTGYTKQELQTELKRRLLEAERSTIFSILSSIEAAFRIDYIKRWEKRKKEPLSRQFRQIYKTKQTRANFENDILETWKRASNVPKNLISEIKGAFKYRHWLAHGRYWNPKLGKKYDYQSVYELAAIVLNSFPFEQPI